MIIILITYGLGIALAVLAGCQKFSAAWASVWFSGIVLAITGGGLALYLSQATWWVLR